MQTGNNEYEESFLEIVDKYFKNDKYTNKDINDFAKNTKTQWKKMFDSVGSEIRQRNLEDMKSVIGSTKFGDKILIQLDLIQKKISAIFAKINQITKKQLKNKNKKLTEELAKEKDKKKSEDDKDVILFGAIVIKSMLSLRKKIRENKILKKEQDADGLSLDIVNLMVDVIANQVKNSVKQKLIEETQHVEDVNKNHNKYNKDDLLTKNDLDEGAHINGYFSKGDEEINEKFSKNRLNKLLARWKEVEELIELEIKNNKDTEFNLDPIGAIFGLDNSPNNVKTNDENFIENNPEMELVEKFAEIIFGTFTEYFSDIFDKKSITSELENESRCENFSLNYDKLKSINKNEDDSKKFINFIAKANIDGKNLDAQLAAKTPNVGPKSVNKKLNSSFYGGSDEA